MIMNTLGKIKCEEIEVGEVFGYYNQEMQIWYKLNEKKALCLDDAGRNGWGYHAGTEESIRGWDYDQFYSLPKEVQELWLTPEKTSILKKIIGRIRQWN